MTATHRTILRPRASAHVGLLLAGVLSTGIFPLHDAAAQYMYIDTNGNGVRDGGDVLNLGCPTVLHVWLRTDANRAGASALCNSGSYPLTINSYQIALRVEGGSLQWGASQNYQTGMTVNFGTSSSAGEFVMGRGGGTLLPAGTYHLASVTVSQIQGSPVIRIISNPAIGEDAGTSFGTGCAGPECDHTYKLDYDWYDTDGVGPPVDGLPPVVAAPATIAVDEGELLSMTVTASDCEAIETLSADLSALPPGNNAVFTPSTDRSSGVLTWNPTLQDAGFYPVRFIASNAKTGTFVTTIEVINRTTVVFYREPAYSFLQLDSDAAFPSGVEDPGFDDSAFFVGTAPFGDTRCSGIDPITLWIPGTKLVARKRFSPGSAMSGAKLRFIIDNDATLYLNGTQVANVQHEECPSYALEYTAAVPSGLIQQENNILVALCVDHGAFTTFDASLTAADVGPIVTVPESVAVLSGQPVSIPVGASDPEENPISSLDASFAALPPGHNGAFTHNASNTMGTATWTPVPADVRPEPYLITFTASNALTGTAVTAITVKGVDTAPLVSAPASIGGNYGTPISFTVTAADPEGQPLDSLTADLSGLPAGSGATFLATADHDSASFSWTPAASAVSASPYPVTFTAWNSLSGSATTDITVTDFDLPPELTAPSSATSAEGIAFTTTISAADPDGDAITALAGDLSALPAGNDAALTRGPGDESAVFSWTPTYADARTPPYTILFIASNALSDSAATSIRVTDVDRAPAVTAPPSATGPPGTPLVFTVSAADPDGDAVDSLYALSLPPGATLAVAADHASAMFTWTPQSGDLCTRRELVFVAQNLLADSAATQVTVSSGACVPEVSAPSAISVRGGVRLEVQATAEDPDGDPISSLTADVSGLPPGNNATFEIDNVDRSSGTLTWTPTLLVDGTFPVMFTASNALSSSATTQITVIPATGPATRRVSISSNGTEGNASSYDGRISGNGRYVVFHSNATNLVADDTNLYPDVFRHDLATGQTGRVSVATDGSQGNGPSVSALVSADGRFVAFTSTASNLVPGDTNGAQDVFVRDLESGTTERVSVSSSGQEGTGPSFGSGISADGRYVAFCSDASNLVPGDLNGTTDAFVRDRLLGSTVIASVASDGTPGNARSCENSAGQISADGRFAAFPSIASNLVPGDTNGQNDVFVRDLLSGTTEIASVSSTGAASNGLSAWPAISADGRFVAFSSTGSTLIPGDGNGTWDIFLRDRTTGATERVSVGDMGAQANERSGYASLSAGAGGVAFLSYASNLVSGDTNGISDIFYRDRSVGTTERVSVDGTSVQAVGPNSEIAVTSLSDDGRFVAFSMSSTNLVPGDINNAADVFVRDRQGTAGSVEGPETRLPHGALLVHPNPSDRGMTVSFLSPQRELSILRIYDLNGRLVRTLSPAPGESDVVRFYWDGKNGRGARVAAGVYFARVSTAQMDRSRKVVIAR